MASVVDELVVTLKLDPADFKRGSEAAQKSIKATSDAARKSGTEMEAAGKNAAQFFATVKTEALGLIGLLVGSGGLAAFATEATHSLTALGQAASHIGVAVPMLGAFRNMIAANGGSADAAAASLTSLTDAMESFRITGQSSMANFFSQMGISRGDNAMGAFEKFTAFAEAHRGDVPLINFMGHGIGLDQGTIDAVVRMKSVAGMHAELAAAQARGVPTPEMAANAAALDKSTTGLGQAAWFAGTSLLDYMAPGLTKTSDAMTTLISKYPELSAAGVLAISGLMAAKPALWVLRLLGLTEAAGALFGLGLLYEGVHPSTTNEGEDEELKKRGLGNRGTPVNPFGDETLSPTQMAFLAGLSQPESGGDYTLKNGGAHFSDFSKFPSGVGAGGTSTASGRYQFTERTWRDVSAAAGLHDFSPASQDKGAWYLASTEYFKKTGRNLEDDLKSGDHQDDINAALRGRWPTLPGGPAYRPPAQVNPYANVPKLRGNPGFNGGGGGGGTSLSVGTIHVNAPMATDATGIAHEITIRLSNELVANANRGLQ